jgi:hypothetical protein
MSDAAGGSKAFVASLAVPHVVPRSLPDRLPSIATPTAVGIMAGNSDGKLVPWSPSSPTTFSGDRLPARRNRADASSGASECFIANSVKSGCVRPLSGHRSPNADSATACTPTRPGGVKLGAASTTDQRRTQAQVLVGVEMNAIDRAHGSHAARVKIVATESDGDFPAGRGEADALALASTNLGVAPRASLRRWHDDQDRRHRHPVRSGLPDGVLRTPGPAPNARRVRVHRPEVVGSEHHDHQRQRRMDSIAGEAIETLRRV